VEQYIAATAVRGVTIALVAQREKDTQKKTQQAMSLINLKEKQKQELKRSRLEPVRIVRNLATIAEAVKL